MKEKYQAHLAEKVVALDNFMLKVLFEDGGVRLYDMKPIIYREPKVVFNDKPIFDELISNPKLFYNAHIGFMGEAVVWNKNIDFPTEEIWCNGIILDAGEWREEDDIAVNPEGIMFYVDKITGMIDYVDLFMYPTDNEHIIPYIDAHYDIHEASYDIRTGRCIAGKLPDIADAQLRKWLMNKKEELLQVWDKNKHDKRHQPKKVPFRAIA